MKKVKVEVQYAPQCPWVTTSLRTVRECVKELEDIAELVEVDVWRHPELARRPTLLAAYVEGKELPNLLGNPNKQLIIEEIRKAADLWDEASEISIEPLTMENFMDEVALCTKHHTYMSLPSEDTKAAVKAKKEWLSEIMRQFNPCAFIAYRDKEPYGFIEFLPQSIAAKIGFPCEMTSEDTAVIKCLLVRQKAWKTGIASKLTQASIDNLRNRGFKKLEVRANKNGLWHPTGFYQKLGFKTARELDDKSCLMFYDMK